MEIQRDARNIHAKGKPLQYHSHVSRSTTGRVRKALLLLQTGFEITENTVTDLKELVCTLNNIKVRIAYDSELQKLLDEDSKVKVSVGEGRLEYAKDETRAGYFKSIGETNILIADLSATIQGEKVTMSKAFIDVLPGEERIIKYSMKQTVVATVTMERLERSTSR